MIVWELTQIPFLLPLNYPELTSNDDVYIGQIAASCKGPHTQINNVQHFDHTTRFKTTSRREGEEDAAPAQAQLRGVYQTQTGESFSLPIMTAAAAHCKLSEMRPQISMLPLCFSRGVSPLSMGNSAASPSPTCTATHSAHTGSGSNH
jgi:hypothetical protein